MNIVTIRTGCLAFVFLLAAGLSGQAAAQPTLADDHPEVYTVKKGDTLWDIAGRFLEEPWQWPEVWRANPEIDNPHLIYPGDRLRLVMENGRPVIMLERDSDRPVVRLSPQMRSAPMDEQIPAIPRALVENFLVDNIVIDPARYAEAPYILGSTGDNLVIGSGDEVLARGDWQDGIRTWGIYRRGESFHDPDTGELLGHEGLRLGQAIIIDSRGDDIRRLNIRQSRQELQAGDRLMTRDAEGVDLYYFPSAPASAVEGRVLSLLGEVGMAAQHDSVLISIGARQGLREGDVLAIHPADQPLIDPVTGEALSVARDRSATLLVYRLFDRLAYGLIVDSTEPVSVGYRVTNP